LAALVAASCGSSDSLMPDRTGLTWTYSVRTGFGAQFVEDVRIMRRLSVTGAEGFELSGPMGAARLAWKKGALWAQDFGNARALPAIPLLRLDRQPAEWNGTLETAFGLEKAAGRLTHSTERLQKGGRKWETVRTELTLERPLGATTLTTWFAPGVGIVRQEQRTRGTLDLRIEWVSGPRAN
jgi:hypothetical protein